MIKPILGWSVIVFLGAVLFVNALFMLASPKAWFRLPSWIRAQGSLTEDKWASGWGATQVRSAGAILLGFIAWVLYHSLVTQPLPKEQELMLILSVIGRGIVALVGIHLAINAAFMFASPRGWFHLPRWLRAQVPLTEQKYASGWRGILLRLTGAILLAVVGWLIYVLAIK